MANLRQRDFRLSSQNSLNFNKIRVGDKKLSDAVSLITDYFEKPSYRMDRNRVDNILKTYAPAQLRDLSINFFKTSGIYSRLCRYMAYLYRYDTFITPIKINNNVKDDKLIEGWLKSALYLDNCNLKKLFGDIALEVVVKGSYYGYLMRKKDKAVLQQLPADYCRSRYKLDGRDAIEFNVKYFDDTFSDPDYKVKVIKMFPKEIQQGYVKYKKNLLTPDMRGDDKGWILLDPKLTFKFNIGRTDTPLFISVIPAILDLDEAKGLDKKRMAQQLLRIIIQKMPLDKNGDMVFDLDEAAQMHQNAVSMIGKAIGVNVLTTFADVEVADMSDKGNMSSADQLEKVERNVYNEAGVSQMQFNTSTNLALEKSIGNDTATMTDLLLQFQDFCNALLEPFNRNPKKLIYQVQLLPTTIYNYTELSKLYKEQTQIGFSKLLPQVALGHSQVSIMATALFENEILALDELFRPPQMSSTISAADQQTGRPKLDDDQKSDKTIANEEASN